LFQLMLELELEECRRGLGELGVSTCGPRETSPSLEFFCSSLVIRSLVYFILAGQGDNPRIPISCYHSDLLEAPSNTVLKRQGTGPTVKHAPSSRPISILSLFLPIIIIGLYLLATFSFLFNAASQSPCIYESCSAVLPLFST
jgi:hypothetical protein